MKIILSRKGFDSQYGGQPSPILPDGTLLSLPIPSKSEEVKYSELYFKGKSYYQIIRDLNSNSSIKENYTCHLDPDIRSSALVRNSDWRPVFGQADAAQGHLAKNRVAENDIFLFYGWFKRTKLVNEKYVYVHKSPDLHVIFGYFQIGEIYKSGNTLPEFAKYHSHARTHFASKPNNCIYIASSELTFNNNCKGASTLDYRENLALTKEGMTRSRWELPEIFKELSISYHTKDSFKENYFQAAAKGQEFVIEANDELIKWVLEIIDYKEMKQ